MQMTKFCDCNSEWDLSYYWHMQKDQIDRKLLTRKQVLTMGNCYVCDLSFWNDADYENMMFDLKEMNS